jgi:hypothetical protein
VTQWEYKRVEEVDLQGGRLDQLGNDGWELVLFIPYPDNMARSDYLFKRPKAPLKGYCRFCQCTTCHANHDADEGPL